MSTEAHSISLHTDHSSEDHEPNLVESLDGKMVPWTGTVHAPGNTDFVQGIGKGIYTIRWMMVPMYLALWVAMAGYTVHYLHEIVEFVFKWSADVWYPVGLNMSADSNEWLMFILELVDITMIANLVVMTAAGGYSTFVKDFRGIPRRNRLKLFDHLDANTLKIKMSMSLAGVSAVHLLKTFIDMDHTANFNTTKIVLQIVIHMVFLISMLLFTWNSNLMHKKDAH